jgi:hypothetical protein
MNGAITSELNLLEIQVEGTIDSTLVLFFHGINEQMTNQTAPDFWKGIMKPSQISNSH